jgi:hypothetical protein
MPSANVVRELRGSQKLLAGFGEDVNVPSADQIRKALSLSDQIKIFNWHTRGQPPAYITMEATLEAPVAEVASLVGQLVKINDSNINLKILINGIPYPDIAQIVVRNTPGE